MTAKIPNCVKKYYIFYSKPSQINLNWAFWFTNALIIWQHWLYIWCQKGYFLQCILQSRTKLPDKSENMPFLFAPDALPGVTVSF
jgi:hypothetical protein